MPIPPSDLTLGLPVPTAAAAEFSPNPHELEGEVIKLFDQFRGPLLRYVFSFGVDACDGEEIIQEVFLALFRHLQRGKSRANLRGWIFRVAHNLASKQLCANHKAREAIESNDDLAARQLDPDPSPEERLVDSERRKHLLAVLRVLPERDQWCLRLRAEGLRYREIAGILGMSLGAVSISLTKSLERLGRADED